jgi:hypothetical protein
MKNAHAIDEARLGIMLNELRLPTIKRFGRNLPSRRTGKDGQQLDSCRLLPSTSWQNVQIAGLNGISPKRTCRLERPWTASPLTLYL